MSKTNNFIVAIVLLGSVLVKAHDIAVGLAYSYEHK